MSENLFSTLYFYQFSSVAQSCPTPCDPMDCSTQGFPFLHYHLEFAQTHVHWVGDTIQPSHPLLSPSPAFNLSQHQGLFQWVSSLHQAAKVLELQLQSALALPIECSGLISFRIDWLNLLAVQGTLGHPWIAYVHSGTSLLWTKMLTSTRRVLSKLSIFVRQTLFVGIIALDYHYYI